MMGTVKQERHDDREINEMARRIAEQNRQKAATAPGMQPGYPAAAAPAGSNQYQMTQVRGQPAIQNYFARNGAAAANGGAAASNGGSAANGAAAAVDDKRLDDESRRGRFGWCEFEKNHIPYIFRTGGEKFTSVRMVERKLLNKFLTALPHELYNNSCYCIRSYYITDIESKLLNEINLKHTDCHFGKEPFTSKDLVVRLSDGKEFYRFLDLCYKKLVLKKSNATDRCGFFRINGESVVPYTMKDTVKYVPLFYFEGETDHLELESDKVDGWDLAYLKFCCKVQGIRNELFADEVCRVVALDEIRGHFPQGTTFEDYWPAKGSIEPVHSQQRVSAGNWTQKPATSSSGGSSGGGSGASSTSTQANSAAAPAAAATATNQSRQQSSMSGYGQAAAASANSRSSTAAAVAAAAATPNAATAAAYDAYNQMVMRTNAAAAALAAQQQQQRAIQQQQQAAANYQLRYDQMIQQAQAAQAAQAAAALVTQHQAAQAALRQQQQQQQQRAAPQPDKSFPGKLTQIKEFTIERSQQAPYKLQKALIDQKIVPCINVRPYVFHDLMMTLPDFVRHFYQDLTIEKARHMLQDVLKVVLYKGNTGHQEILRSEGKCNQYDPVPLVLVKDIMNYMPQMKYMFNSMSSSAGSSDPAAKRMRVS